MRTNEKLSLLWVFVMFNMAFADIVGFMNPGVLDGIINGKTPIKITEELMLVFSIFLEIPIAMFVLSRLLRYRANRWANIVAATITIPFVIFGGSPVLSYIFFATIEVTCMLFIIWSAWRWSDPKDDPL